MHFVHPGRYRECALCEECLVSQVSFNERVRVWKFVIIHDSSVLWFPSCTHRGGSLQMCVPLYFPAKSTSTHKKKGAAPNIKPSFSLIPNFFQISTLLSALIFPSDVPKLRLCSENYQLSMFSLLFLLLGLLECHRMENRQNYNRCQCQ